MNWRTLVDQSRLQDPRRDHLRVMAGRGIWTSSFRSSSALTTRLLLKPDLLAHRLNHSLSRSIDLRNLNHGNLHLKDRPTGRQVAQVQMEAIDPIPHNIGRRLGTRQHPTANKVELQAHNRSHLSLDHKLVTNKHRDNRHRDHNQPLLPLILNPLDLLSCHRLHWIK